METGWDDTVATCGNVKKQAGYRPWRKELKKLGVRIKPFTPTSS